MKRIPVYRSCLLLAIEIHTTFHQKTQPWTCSSIHDKLRPNRPCTGEDISPPPFFFLFIKYTWSTVSWAPAVWTIPRILSNWFPCHHIFSTSHKAHLIDGLHNPDRIVTRCRIFFCNSNINQTNFNKYRSARTLPSFYDKLWSNRLYTEYKIFFTDHKVHFVGGSHNLGETPVDISWFHKSVDRLVKRTRTDTGPPWTWSKTN